MTARRRHSHERRHAPRRAHDAEEPIRLLRIFPAIYAVVRNLEIEISWIEHGRGARSPRYPTLPTGRRVSLTAQGEVNA